MSAPVLWPPHAKSWLIRKDSDAWRDWGQEEKGTTEDEMAGWHHQLDGHEFEWTPGIGDGQGGLVCCDSWVSQRVREDWVSEMNWNEPVFLKVNKAFWASLSLRREIDMLNPSLSHAWLFAPPWTPLSMAFSRQEYWNGLLFPFPGCIPDPGIELASLALVDSLPLSHQGKL